MSVLLVNGNALSIPLADNSVHCVITSPPYWGLRSYGHWQMQTLWGLLDDFTLPRKAKERERWWFDIRWRAAEKGGIFSPNGKSWIGALGLEPTPELYVAHMVAVFREVKRVLRPDGVVFLNLGDSYYSSQSSRNRVIIREDLTAEELYAAALGIRRYMPELWQACWQETGEGALPELLREEVQSGASRKSTRASKKLLPSQPGEVHGSNKKAMGEKKSRSNSTNGWEVCMLRRDGTDVPLLGSYQGERSEGLSENRWHARGLEKSDSGRSTEGQVPPFMLELQFGIRFIRFLSTLKLDLSDIPNQLQVFFKKENGLKEKDLVGIPWAIATALRADGWWLRSELPWLKRNSMPESADDRPNTSIEKVFLLTKSSQYYFDMDAVKVTGGPGWMGSSFTDRRDQLTKPGLGMGERTETHGRNWRNGDMFFESLRAILNGGEGMLNDGIKPLALVVNTVGYPGAHFATYPPALVEPCIKAGCPEGGIVLDPFAGSGTTLLVARQLGRNGIGLDLSLPYLREQARERLGLAALEEWTQGKKNGKAGELEGLPMFEGQL